MNKPVYEIPIGDESYPPAPGRRSAGVPPVGAPVPTPDAAPGYLNAPPPATAAAFDWSQAPAPTSTAQTPPAYPAAAPTPPFFDASAFDAPAGTPTFDAPPPPAAAAAAPPVAAPTAAAPTAAPAAAPNYEGTGSPSAFDFGAVPPPAAASASLFGAPPTSPFGAPSYEAAPPPAYTPPAEQTALPASSTMATAAASAAAPAASSTVDRSPQTGEGQVGSHPDIVAALNAVVTAKASDLHVSAGAPPMIRVDGGLRPILDAVPWDHDRVTTALHSILTDRQKEEFESDLELDFAYQLSPTSRFRVNIYQQRDHLGAAFRLIPTEIKQLHTLGVPDSIGKFAELARGLVLVTGPTGSGKSTTLAALIDLVNTTRADHIVTVEDPIEFVHENKKSLVNQREVGHDTHSFANALKHVLRQDPDVILIGELRDLETISVALTAAETGHLVFATLHTQDAAQTIDRVIDVFPPHQQGQVRAQLAATLQGVVSQTLVKKVGGGRAVATEVLITTPAISNLIREGKTYQITSMMQSGRDLGMHSMDQHLADLVNAGQISQVSAYEKSQNAEDLKQLIQRAATSNPRTAAYDPASNGMGV